MRFVTFVLLASACGGGATSADGGASDGQASLADAAPGRDGTAPLTWVDFAVDGCEAFDPDAPACRGRAPLTLRFVPVAPAPVDAFIWTFGDGEMTQEPAPVHTFALPGAYDVSLVAGGPGGTAMITKTGFIVVEPAPLGAGCGVDAHCETGLCLCGDGVVCPAPLAGGVCTLGCDFGCVDGSACADLGDGGDPWRGTWCLAVCDDMTPCPAGTACADLLLDDGSWGRVCFPPGVLAPDGGSCAAPDGSFDGGLCASGWCEPFGARGLCAARCESDGDCAPGAACATFADGVSRCLAGCSAGGCASDPWLACEAPSIEGAFGFTIAGTPDPAGYCAPRRCLAADQCGLTGSCVAGFCGP